jgi:4-alpha-glucanotransferase
MNITFRINYKTAWGQNLRLCGSGETLGNWDAQKSLAMIHLGNGEWEATIETENTHFQYKYILQHRNLEFEWEGGTNRNFDQMGFNFLKIRDFWRPQIDAISALQTKVFTKVLMKPKDILLKPPHSRAQNRIRFCMNAPRVMPGYQLAIIGNQEVLGKWKTPIPMDASNFPVWHIDLDYQQLKFPVTYKYVIVDALTGRIRIWEDGPERQIFYIARQPDQFLYIRNDQDFAHPSGKWRGAGVAVPIFSLRTQESFGVGEFNDLKKLADWGEKSGMKMIQVLPINETVATHSWLDSYPYKAISVMALHPMYLNIEKMGKLKDKQLMLQFEEKKQELNNLTYVDYVAVNKSKSRYYKLIFDQEYDRVKNDPAFTKFFDQNKEWLIPYAVFCYLRDKFKTSNFREWDEWATFNLEKVLALANPKHPHHEHIAVHYFIQYHLDKQLREAIDYAHSKGIAIKGDIPIGISPNSIEAWTLPHLFNLNGQAGAPPDDFAVQGQNWGFPTYQWDEMAKDNYAWWQKRLKGMSKYFDAYRIDHILGFFRIWEIPIDSVNGLGGYFKPALPLTPAEIEERGIWFDSERLVKPYIRNHFLHELFGEYTDEVKQLYLNEIDTGIFELKQEISTQRKIYEKFTPGDEFNQKITEKNVTIRDGLMALANEVIFIIDPYSETPSYHPRISMHDTNSYRELDSDTKWILNELYVDFYYRRHDQFWKEEAMRKLPTLLKASNMLVCGEDLGMVPSTVPEVMKLLNILSLEIERMPKDPKVEFAQPATSPYLSVCTTSTHDMATLRGWWEEDRAKTARYYHNILGHNDEMPYFSEPWICREIINRHLYSPAMWTIFPIQDLLALDADLRWDDTDKERINVPSDEKNKWQYRMILPLEELLEAKEFNEMLLSMINFSGRNSD